jgi:7-cyano-7-deazaguanine synthase
MFHKERAVALLSGGLDSTVSLAEGMQKYDVVVALTFNYGQRAYGKEIRASRVIADHYHVDHKIIALPWLSELLPETMKMRKEGREPMVPIAWQRGAERQESFFEAKPVWVPNRNGVLINVAASFAEAYDAKVVLFGANAEEAERFPDNTEDFRDRMNDCLTLSTLNHVRVECPMGFLHKSEIVDRARELNVPLHLIWSCYADTEHQCGVCPSCYRLKDALRSSTTGSMYMEKMAFIN